MKRFRVLTGLRPFSLTLAAAGLLAAVPAWSADFRVTDEIDLQINTNIVAGAAWRLNGRSTDLVGKSNLDPNVCARQFQSCQGLSREQSYPAERLANAPGAPTVNGDDGNLNYDQGDIVQAPFRINQDFNLSFGDFGFFGRWLWFYDFENNSFTERSPNRITPGNLDDVVVEDDFEISNRYLDQVFSAGGAVESERRQGRTLSQVGTDFQLLDLNFYGRFPLDLPYFGERDFVFRIGRQTVNWGESTVLVVNSVNQANPANVNNLYRTGFTLDEVFTPVGMAFGSINLSNNVSIEAYYQYEWDSVEIPPQGSYFSFLDFGTPNVGQNPQSDRLAPSVRDGETPRFSTNTDEAVIGSFNASFGGAAEDPFFLGGHLDNALSVLTPTTASIPRIADNKPDDQGQYGVGLKWFLPDLNYGTEFGFYFMNYHSKLPYLNAYSSSASCARPEGNPAGISPTTTTEFLQACDNLPLAFNTRGTTQLALDLVSLATQRPGVLSEIGVANIGAIGGIANLLIGNPNEPVDSIVSFDDITFQLDYPEDRKMFGLSFNTPAGANYSMQGEVAYRPNLPLQVSFTDVAFAALGPSLSECHKEDADCAGASAAEGFDAEGDRVIYEQNNFVDADGNNPYPDTINLAVGALPGVARAFPNFVLPYRGQDIGSNPAGSFIRGWEPFDVLQYNLGATRVYGQSDAILGADQIIMIYEVGATHVLGFPDFDQLQIQGPDRQTTHATAGADGTGADGSRLACSTNPACSVGVDGLRFNPTQARRDEFAHRFSWGYRIVSIIRYDSVLPGLSIEPTLIWGHDINGNAPGPGPNFVEGRKTLNSTFQFRYKTALSFNVSYQLFTGGGENHVLRDRDNLGFFVRYQF
ncbi:DUF1302 domain-containing protein [Algiphilus aromaticivorans]|jgi:hypothetical protein|uniref:DUF1302 domain-containing protein n=1 Tax=Algiphilus aromaticivorans TaxID=382454 RepID=UPI000ACE0DB7|nr:DUF1302 family protein [Algiphilus aromaticivorans]